MGRESFFSEVQTARMSGFDTPGSSVSSYFGDIDFLTPQVYTPRYIYVLMNRTGGSRNTWNRGGQPRYLCVICSPDWPLADGDRAETCNLTIMSGFLPTRGGIWLYVRKAFDYCWFRAMKPEKHCTSLKSRVTKRLLTSTTKHWNHIPSYLSLLRSVDLLIRN
jgi:hypothetical protein